MQGFQLPFGQESLMSLWAPLCTASDAHKNYEERDGWILEKEQKPLQKGVLVQQSHGRSSAASEGLRIIQVG